MATIEYNVIQDFVRNKSRHVIWSGMTQGDVGQVISLAGHQDKTVHFFGSFGGATVTLYGSNDPLAATDPASASWVAMKGATGFDLNATSAALELIAENPIYIRPVVNATGAGAFITVSICARIV